MKTKFEFNHKNTNYFMYSIITQTTPTKDVNL